jgi:hypothetical protein
MDNEPGESFYRLILGLEGIGTGSEPVDLLFTDVLNEGEIISKTYILELGTPTLIPSKNLLVYIF